MMGGLRVWDVGGYFVGYAFLLLLLTAVFVLASILHVLLSIGGHRAKRPRTGLWIHGAGIAFTVSYSMSLIVSVSLAI